ncbi:MAG: ferrous iron transporter B [Oscillospiraceae bacterium]|nr:ferrous iron transporter B [Oscillospiraceae bacterium]
MGLTRNSVGKAAADTGLVIKKRNESDRVIALAGNPNVGKSTVFNELTGLRQHTGNWPGKTVTNAQGYCERNGRGYVLVDIPGTYSLFPHSAEEEVAREFICSGRADAVVVVCDATCLERNLILVLQTAEIAENVIVCINLMDEARKKKIEIDLSALSRELSLPVVATEARGGKGLTTLLDTAETAISNPSGRERTVFSSAEELAKTAERIFSASVKKDATGMRLRSERTADKILTSRAFGFPLMFLMLLGIFWLTIEGANYPSSLLSGFLLGLEDELFLFTRFLHLPVPAAKALVYGVYRTLSWVVSVMLPPMAIFFPLFTLLEDLGYLPRVAFNMDRIFKKCGACGKQCLTTCMGFGCNAAGVVGCRIIDSPRERLIAMLTNSFIPCNGRFPALISILTIFFIGSGGGAVKSILASLYLTALILLGIFMSFLASRLLSSTLLRGVPSSFTLELPPYRRPQVTKVIVRSVFDRTLFVLGRAISAAAPAGLLIWLMANLTVGGENLLSLCSGFLDPFARVLGLDGVILMAFILGLPANEIVIPLIIMSYTAGGALTDISDLSTLSALLQANGWSIRTAVCVMLFSLMHWPCATTLMTIKKESGSLFWTMLAAVLPTLFGIISCLLVCAIAKILP